MGSTIDIQDNLDRVLQVLRFLSQDIQLIDEQATTGISEILKMITERLEKIGEEIENLGKE